jgi:hypothetical protein
LSTAEKQLCNLPSPAPFVGMADVTVSQGFFGGGVMPNRASRVTPEMTCCLPVKRNSHPATQRKASQIDEPR